MKRMMAAGLFFNVAVLGWIHFTAVVCVNAAEGPVENGDVNGDEAIDISDVIYLLATLFTGGPTVKQIECPVLPPRSALPDTGQSLCIFMSQGGFGVSDTCCKDGEGACPAWVYGQDGSHETGCPS